jgi:hypothetical protein
VTISAVSSIVSGRPALTWFDTFGCKRLLRPVQYTLAPASPRYNITADNDVVDANLGDIGEDGLEGR